MTPHYFIIHMLFSTALLHIFLLIFYQQIVYCTMSIIITCFLQAFVGGKNIIIFITIVILDTF